MTDDPRPHDPFAKLATLGADQKLFVSQAEPPKTPPAMNPATQEPTRPRGIPRGQPRENSRTAWRGMARDLPTRDEIQEFSFRLRDEVNVKVQAEVPHAWQDELEEIAHRLDVKKLELYRFILGEFLGKVRRGSEE